MLMKPKKNQKYIYVIFSHTRNRIAGMIRAVTRYDYNHCSISTDPELTEIYSFARYYLDTPFYGGFVRESANRYHYGAEVARIKVCAVPVSVRQYETACSYIKNFEFDDNTYLYNMISAACFPFHKRVFIDRAYTCIEFVISVLCRCRAPGVNKIPRFCSIKQLDDIYSKYMIYEGEFPENAGSPREIDNYRRKNGLRYRVGNTVTANARLIKRFCRKLAHRGSAV